MNNTPKRKLRVGILFGGKSAEHEVSIQSARNILEALDKNKFEPLLIGIDKDGRWKLHNVTALQSENITAALTTSSELGLSFGGKNNLVTSSNNTPLQAPLDVIFPILHGPLGEDGAIQGLLEMADVPYVGAGILGSAVGMDKDIMKRLLREAGVPIAKHITLRSSQQQSLDPKAIIETLGVPLFIKPANMGSSIGVSRATNELELLKAIELGFTYDGKVLVERAVDGDEVECAILGNERPRASVPGRITFKAGFYTYEAKYNENEGTRLEIPAKLSEQLQNKIQQTAIRAYKALECEGMARIDMFVSKQGQVVVNEINTLPGFTKFSMYPQLWEASGLSYTNLITELLELAIDRASKRREFFTTHNVAIFTEDRKGSTQDKTS